VIGSSVLEPPEDGSWEHRMVKSVSAQYNDVHGASRSYPTPPPATEGGTTSRDVELPRVGASKGEGEALYPLAPEDFWEPEIPPYEDRSAFLDPLSTPETGTRTDGADAKHMAATLTVELVRPTRVMLELTKTSMGIWQHGRGGTRTKMETHTYVAITSTVRSREERPLQQEHRFQPSSSTRDQPMQIEEANAAPLPRFTILPSQAPPPDPVTQLPVGATFGMRNGSRHTPTEEVMAFDMSRSPKGQGPIFFNRDGTVTLQGPAKGGVDGHGRSLDVHELLRTKDWSRTP